MAWNFSTATYDFHDEKLEYSEGSWNQESTATILRRVRRRNGTTFNPLTDPANMVSEGAVKGNLSNFGTSSPYTAANRVMDTMRCISTSYSWDVQLLTVLVTQRFASPYFVSDTSPNTGLMLPSSMSWQTVTRTSKIYRTGWSVNPPPTSDASADIGGTAVQGAGATGTERVAQMRLRFNFTRDASLVGGAMDTVANNLALALDTKNSIAFNVFPAETLICEGYNITLGRMPFYEVSVDMLWDAWAHHEQIAEVGTDGRPNWNSGNLNAVYWKRAARASFDFNLLFGSPVDTVFRARTFKGWVG
jgi:hypothetical protein